MYSKLLLFIFYCNCIQNILSINNTIILSSGLYNWSSGQLNEQYNFFKVYKNLNIITASSILTYVINSDGNIDLIPTSNYSNIDAEQYQYKISTDLNLPAYPCIFCDATIGFCTNFDDISEKIFKNQIKFINDLIDRSIKYNWSGYVIDFESDRPIDNYKLTNLMIDLGNALYKYNKRLYIWIEYSTYTYYPFNISRLIDHNNIYLLTMNTYNSNYNMFIDLASSLMIHSKSFNRIGYGMITYDNMKMINSDLHQNSVISNIEDIIKWLKINKQTTLSLWASIIPPNWYIPLNNFLS